MVSVAWETSFATDLLGFHMTLKFGTMYKTPVMQAGLIDRPLTFRMIFMAEAVGRRFFVITVVESQRLFLLSLMHAA